MDNRRCPRDVSHHAARRCSRTGGLFLCAASCVALHFRFQTAETFKRFAKLLDFYFCPIRADDVLFDELPIHNNVQWLDLQIVEQLREHGSNGEFTHAVQLRLNTRTDPDRAGAGSAAAGLDRYPLYFGGMALLCTVLRTVPLEQAFYWRSAVCWGFAAVVMVTGGCQWLVSCIKYPA